jgi:hypothetical protein
MSYKSLTILSFKTKLICLSLILAFSCSGDVDQISSTKKYSFCYFQKASQNSDHSIYLTDELITPEEYDTLKVILNGMHKKWLVDENNRIFIECTEDPEGLMMVLTYSLASRFRSKE